MSQKSILTAVRYHSLLMILYIPVPFQGQRVFNLDLILSIVFGTISATAFVLAVWCLRKALKVSGTRDGDLKMFVWAMGSMIGLIVSGMSAAYILLPILIHRLG